MNEAAEILKLSNYTTTDRVLSLYILQFTVYSISWLGHSQKMFKNQRTYSQNFCYYFGLYHLPTSHDTLKYIKHCYETIYLVNMRGHLDDPSIVSPLLVSCARRPPPPPQQGTSGPLSLAPCGPRCTPLLAIPFLIPFSSAVGG